MTVRLGTGSYDVDAEGAGRDAEIDRLRAQKLLSWPEEVRLLEWLGLADGMRVLEVGCGPGFVTADLLARYPNSPVTALDSDPGMLALACVEAGAAATGRLTLVEGSAGATGLPPGGFDFALARFVYQHVSDREAASDELLRVLRPGGIAAVVDIDASLWGVVEPFSPDVAPLYERYARRQAERGGDRLVARRLWRLLAGAGFVDLRLQPFAWHSDALGADPFEPQINPERLIPMLRDGDMELDEFGALVRAHERFRADPDRYVLMMGFVATGRRPETPGRGDV